MFKGESDTLTRDTYQSFGKLNLTLDVLEKRPEDGYHYIRSIMVPISLNDQIRISPADQLSVTVNPDIAGPPEANLAYRAAALLQRRAGLTTSVNMMIEKRIPVAGGLAGGSTNAATVLKALNQMWRLGLTEAELVAMGIKLGSDVPFFITGLPARVEGIGEVITPILVKEPLWFVLVVPDVEKSTGNVYRLFDELEEVVVRPDSALMEKALQEGNLTAVARNLGNVFEQVMLPRNPVLRQAKSDLAAAGALGVLMSGAGPTIFGLVESQSAATKVAETLKPKWPRTYVVHSVAQGSERL